MTATVATHPRGSITVSKEALGSNVTSRGNIIQNVAPLVWLSIQTHLEVSERQRQTPLPRLLLGSIISWRRAPRKLTSCYRAAVSKAQTAAVSCSDGAAARKRRAGNIKTPGWAAPSSPTRLLFIHHHRLRNRTGMQLRVTESPDLQVLQSSYARKRASVSSGLFFFCAIQKIFFFLNCQTQCTGVFLCGRVSLDDFGKCEGATVVTLHYVRQLGAFLWSRLISSSNRFIQIQLP